MITAQNNHFGTIAIINGCKMEFATEDEALEYEEYEGMTDGEVIRKMDNDGAVGIALRSDGKREIHFMGTPEEERAYAEQCKGSIEKALRRIETVRRKQEHIRKNKLREKGWNI